MHAEGSEVAALRLCAYCVDAVMQDRSAAWLLHAHGRERLQRVNEVSFLHVFKSALLNSFEYFSWQSGMEKIHS